MAVPTPVAVPALHRMNWMRTTAFLLALIAAALSLFVFGPKGQERRAAPSLAYQKAKADALFESSFKQFSSTKVALAQFRGRPVIAYFWASWCVECRDETKALAALQLERQPSGLAVIGIGVDQADQLERFTRDNAITYPVFVAGRDGIELSKKMGNLRGELPFIGVIDRRGVWVAKHLGKLEPQTLDAMAAAALQ